MNLLSSTALALSFLIGSTIKATLLLVLAAGVAHALRGQSAAGRHHVWSLGIAGLLVLPFLTLLLPTWHSRTLGNAARFLAPAHAGAQSTGFQDLPSMVINAATASPLSVQFSQMVSRICRQLGMARRVQVLRCADAASMPLTWGILRPRVLLPAGAMEWSSVR